MDPRLRAWLPASAGMTMLLFAPLYAAGPESITIAGQRGVLLVLGQVAERLIQRAPSRAATAVVATAGEAQGDCGKENWQAAHQAAQRSDRC